MVRRLATDIGEWVREARLLRPIDRRRARAHERRGARVHEGRLVGSLVGALLMAGLAVPGVSLGAAPVIEQISVDETFVDEFLSDACGVTVTTTARGDIIVRTFSGEGTGVAELRTINLNLTATAGDRTIRFRDVGADLVRIEPDGTAVLSIIGQVPFDFRGVLKVDLETGDAILEPRDISEEQLAKACGVLTGG